MAEIIEISRHDSAVLEPPIPASIPPPEPLHEAPDEQARERALDVSASWIVEAPAGSGKTGLLLQRYLKLLGSAGVTQPEQVLAITFTRAATEEIRARVQQELAAAAEDERPAATPFEAATRALARAALVRDRQLGWGLLDDPGRLRVRSIDSVAGEIARLSPVTSGGGMANPVDEPFALYREAARRTTMHLGGDDGELSQALVTLLLHRDGDLAACEALIAEMLGSHEQWGRIVPAAREELTEEALERDVRPRLDHALEYAICSTLTRVQETLSVGFLRRLAGAAAFMGDRPGYRGEISPIALCSGREEPPEAIAEHLHHWRLLAHLLITPSTQRWRARLHANDVKFELTKEDRALLTALVDEVRGDDEALRALCALTNLPPARYPDEQWDVATALFRVLHRARIELRRVFVETGECDFAEPALLAVATLRQPGGADAYATALGTDLRHLLVDELQDTSTGQYELLELLTAGWQGAGRSVFLVGDPKQSIYLFRQARVERFVRTMQEQRLGGLGVGRLRLSANFRSQAELVTGFNETFARVFPARSAEGNAIVYTPAQATRRTDPAQRGHAGQRWHPTVVRGSDAERRQERQKIIHANASRVREIIAGWRSRPLPPGRVKPWSIAVLVASRRELKPILAALKRDKGDGAIPFRAVNVEPLREQQEILDLVALTRALRHPADRVAWWALLRAPWCGLGLRDLHLLAGADDATFAERTVLELVRERGDLLDAAGLERLEPAWTVLAGAVAQTGRVPLPELIERTWIALRGDSYLLPEALANARQYFELIEGLYRETGDLAMERLERRLDRLFAAASEARDAVDLMTIHGAKGLEWDVVLVPELERKAPVQRSRLLEWEELTDGGEDAARVVFAPISGKGEESGSLTRWLRSVRAGRLAAERRRQFYVACTRAREELHLFATARQDKAGALTAPSASLLEAAWPAAAPHFGDGGQSPRTQEIDSATKIAGDHAREPAVLSLAAVAEDTPRPAQLRRLPLGVLREALDQIRAVPPVQTSLARIAALARPEGSFAARTLGNAVHAFLELAAAELAAGGRAPAELHRELAAWQPRIRAVLRADGLAPAQVDRLAETVLFALRATLSDPVGRWLLEARADARSEYALTLSSGERSRVRLDRLFRAGAEPLAPGAEQLWIIDYKTGSHADDGLDAWLEEERSRYTAQMNAYARAFPNERVNVGLWYPLLSRLVWWQA